MDSVYDSRQTIRTREEWQILLDWLLNDLARHIGIELQRCSFFIEEHIPGEQSFGCHLDFRGPLCKALGLELCGILSYNVNWNESVWIGTHVLYFHSSRRMEIVGNSDTVLFMPRTAEGWQKPQVENDDGGEWAQYTTTERWN